MSIKSIKAIFSKKEVLIFVLLSFVVTFLQSIIFSDQLKYGFRDGDWWILAEYKKLGNFSLNHFIETWKHHGVYTYQVYYMGFAESIVGLNFQKLHLVTHLVKWLATLSVFFLILIIAKNRLTAFLATIIYAVAYPTAGAMFMMVTGGYFVAIIAMSAFLISFRLTFENIFSRWKLLTITVILFLLTLLLNTERMYPLIPLILLAETFWLWRKNFSKKSLVDSFYTLATLLLPLVIFYGIYILFIKSNVVQARFAEGFMPQISIRIKYLLDGNWQLLLYPFASFGSLFLFGDWWKLFGHFNTTTFSAFIFYFITKPMLVFSITTTLIMYLISKRPLKFILINLIPVFIFGVIIFVMTRNWDNINLVTRIHYDNDVIGLPALFGFYILSLSFSIFLAWLKNESTSILPVGVSSLDRTSSASSKPSTLQSGFYRDEDEDKKALLYPLFLGSFVPFLFIFTTWIVSDVQLVFMGPQRYLTTPAIGSSLFLASLIVLVFRSLQKTKLGKPVAWISFFALVPIILVNAQVAKEFFNYELNFAGMNGLEQTRMKNKFWSYVPNLNNTEPSFFYFDETADYKNGYFDESTILAGFDDWIRFDHGKDLILNRPKAYMLRTNVHCPEHTHQNCLKILKEGFTVRNGIPGIWYKDPFNSKKETIFYRLSNFYALRFINKDIIDIKDEVVSSFKTNE